MLKVTELKIAPKNSWEVPGIKNPLVASIKLRSETSTIECVLSEDAMRRMIDLCADEIAASAEARVREFVQSVNAIEGRKDHALLGQEE